MRMKLKNKNSKKFNKIFIVFIIVFIIVTIIKMLNNGNKLILNYATTEAELIASKIINDTLEIDDENNLYRITKNSNDEIEMVDYNTNYINKYLDKLSNQIDKNIKDNFKKNKITVPLGIITNNILFNNLGPQIPIKLTLVGSSLTNIKSNVKNYGLNNALIEIIVEVIVKVKILLPITTKTVTISNDIPISYKIMNTSIPYYFGTYKND